MLVFVYFIEKMYLLRNDIDKKERNEQTVQRAPMDPFPVMMPVQVASPVAIDKTRDLTRSLILAVSVCYHARLGDRKEYEERIARQFTPPLVLSGGVQQFRNEIRW